MIRFALFRSFGLLSVQVLSRLQEERASRFALASWLRGVYGLWLALSSEQWSWACYLLLVWGAGLDVSLTMIMLVCLLVCLPA